MRLFGGLMFLLALALFAVVDGFAGAAYHRLGIAEIDGQWLEMGTLALLILAFMGALKIAEVRHERERRRGPTGSPPHRD